MGRSPKWLVISIFTFFESATRGRGQKDMVMTWLEAVLPLGIIAGMLCVTGNAQYFIHKAAMAL